jgi:hypothetical protein
MVLPKRVKILPKRVFPIKMGELEVGMMAIKIG